MITQIISMQPIEPMAKRKKVHDKSDLRDEALYSCLRIVGVLKEYQNTIHYIKLLKMLTKWSVNNKGSNSALDTKMNIWEYMRWGRKCSSLMVFLKEFLSVFGKVWHSKSWHSTGSMHFTQALFHAQKSQSSVFSPVVCIETDCHT